jgi:hypothetical protein
LDGVPGVPTDGGERVIRRCELSGDLGPGGIIDDIHRMFGGGERFQDRGVRILLELQDGFRRRSDRLE